MHQVKSFLKFARPQIIVTMAALVLLGSLIAGVFNFKTVIALILVSLAIAHANSVNDYSDRQIDQVNLKDAKDRPLVSGELSDKDFWRIHLVCGVIALLLSPVFGIPAVLFTIAIIIFDYIYSLKPIRLTDRTFASPLLLAVCYAFYPLSLGFWSGNGTVEYPWMLGIGIYLAFVARMLLKDFRDVKGDAQFGKITFLVRYGAKTTCFASAILWVLAFLATAYAMHFIPGVMIPLSLALIQAWMLLNILWKVQGKDIQQRIIVFIANAANFSILAIFISLLAQQHSSSALVTEVLPAVIGGTLLVMNFTRYSQQRDQLFAKTQSA